ncbi:MAG: hypothetical protein Q8P63_01155 [Candidatus Nealsonbacteria bacterium]|nr:hypothetical protein [Candidatus Nealsonbacteria bacterium]
MNQAFSKIWILIILTIFIAGGFFTWQYFRISQIKSLEIIPSQKTEQGIVYQEDAKAIIIGKNLDKVELYQRGGGTGIYTSPEGGLIGMASKIKDSWGKESWEVASLPIERLIAELCAVGFDEKENKIGEVCIYNVYGGVTKTSNETADWQTYKNDEYGFEIKYPSEFTFSSEGPNSVQYTIDRGEQISGTVQPSYDTIIFFDGNNEVDRVEIFHKYAKDILEENYQDKEYLYLFGPCDIRWGFQPEVFNLNSINNVDILIVKGKNQEDVSQTCGYLKNSDGNLIVISNKEYKSEIFNQMFSTFKFLK